MPEENWEIAIFTKKTRNKYYVLIFYVNFASEKKYKYAGVPCASLTIDLIENLWTKSYYLI